MATNFTHRTALVVEDNAFQRSVVVMFLKRLGFGHVEAATGAASAIGRLLRHNFDLVLCDIAMPDGDGTELMSALLSHREEGAGSSQPAWIWTSGLAPDVLLSHVELAKAVGLSQVAALEKPVTQSSLAQILDVLLHEPLPANIPSTPAARDLAETLPRCAELQIFLQPQVSLLDGALVGAEVLCRWNHPEFGLLSPALFWPRVEAENRGPEFLEDAWRRCLALQQSLRAKGVSIPFGFNASAATLCHDGLIERLDDMVTESRLPRSAYTIELTEGYPVHDFQKLSIVLNRLRVKGYGVSVDDFGIGISTLKLLSDLPFTQIKIDRCFVNGVATAGQQGAICEGIVFLARKLGIECVAEGIETVLQRKALQEMGCHTGQGYLWSRPLPALGFANYAMVRLTHRES